MSGSPRVSRLLLLLGLAIGVTRLAAELPVDSYELRRNQAFALSNNQSPESEKALLALLKERPNDGSVLFALGRVAVRTGNGLDPGNERRKFLKLGREYFLQARKAGFDDPYIATTLASVNIDGSENKGQLSANQEVDRLLKAGDALFAKRDFSAAIQKYREVIQLEPDNYLAVLYVGDCYFGSGQNAEAIEWYAKAGALNPNREQAFRYAGDALTKVGRGREAGERYVAAVVAEPYSGYPWRALNQYCQANLIKPWTTPANVPQASISGTNGKKDLGIPKEFTPIDIAYGSARIQWQEANCAKKFPAGAKYRLTLEEEAHGLRSALKVYTDNKQNAEKLPTEVGTTLEKQRLFLDHLVEIEAAGLLEAHILFVRINADLAQDYTAYRDAHRDLLRDYLTRFYLHLP